MSKIRLYGGTSGYVELAAPDVSDDATLTLPTGAAGFVPGNSGIGTNVVQTVKTDAFTTTSTSFTDLTGLTVTITPTSATSKVLVLVSVAFAPTSLGQTFLRMNRNGSDITAFIGDAAGSRTSAIASGGFFARDSGFGTVIDANTNDPVMILLDSPASTSAQIYQVTIAVSSGTTRVNGNGYDADLASSPRVSSSITAIEVAA